MYSKKLKKLVSYLTILSILGQIFLFSNPALANSNNNENNQLKYNIKQQEIVDSIKNNSSFANAKIEFQENDKIRSISNFSKKSSGDKINDLEQILGNTNNKFSAKNNDNGYKILKELDDNVGGKHTRINQIYKGIPVFGKQAILHEDGNNIKGVSMDLQDISLDINPTKTSYEAIQIGRNSLTSSQDIEVFKEPELIIYPTSEYSSLLAYHFELKSKNITSNKDERWEFFVDAKKGKIIKSFNKIQELVPSVNGFLTSISGSLMTSEGGDTITLTGYKDNTNSGYFLRNYSQKYILYNISTNSGIYNDANSFVYKNTSSWGNSDPIEISAANNISTTLKYFKNNYNFGPDNITSLSGGMLYVYVHKDMDNAYWDGVEIVIGDGDGITDGSLAVLDVIGHEFSHAWTEYTSNLVYYGEPGALNESFSDIMGTNIEFYGQASGTGVYPDKQAGKSDWFIGEDIAFSGAFRDMQDPKRLSMPSRFMGTYWYNGTGDNGGVHYNSSIQNFFYYLLVNGGSGNNDGINYSVNGIGLSQASQLAYNTNAYYILPSDNYARARLAWIDAANNLDSSGNLANSVKQAWDAVGVQSDVLNQYNSIIDYKFISGASGDFTSSGFTLWSYDSSTGGLDSGSMVSGLISDGQSTEISWSGTTSSGFLGFRYKTSSEDDYDELNFYIDGTLYASRSGNSPWLFHNQLVTGGNHILSWKYEKDISDTKYLDKVWIDDITLPVGSSGSFNFSGINQVVFDNNKYYSSGTIFPINISANKTESTVNFLSGDLINSNYNLGNYTTGTTNIQLSGTGNGDKNIIANLVDKIGNSKTITGIINFDNTGPAGPTFSSFSSGQVFHSSGVLLSWNDSVDSGIGIQNKYDYILSNSYNSYYSSGTTSGTGVTKNSLGDGEYLLYVRGYDKLGNIGDYNTGTFVIDNGTPTCSGIFLSGAYTNSLTNTIKLTSSEQISYIISSSGITNSVSGITNSGIVYLPVTLTGSDGIKTVNIDYADNAGNTGSIVTNITLDTQAPSYMLNIYDGFVVSGVTITLTGTVVDLNSGVGSVSVGGNYLTGSLSSWSSNYNLNAGNNLINFIFADNLGNSTSTGINIIRTSIPSNIGSVINSTGSVIINFSTDISATGGIIYGTGINNLNNDLEGNLYSTGHTFNLNGLDSNTTYYYKVFGKNLGYSGQLSGINSFNTPQQVSDTSGSQIATGSVIFSGATSSGLTFSSSTGSATIVSNNGVNSLILSFSGLTIISDGANWNGIIQGPEVYNTGLSLSLSGYSRVGNYYEIGNYNSSLSLSGNSAIVSINIGTQYNGKTLQVYRSGDRVNFSPIATCLVASGICQFNTNHFSLFAFGEPSDSTPDNFSFNAVTNSELGQQITSNTITLTGFNVPVNISISGGLYSINGGVYTGATSQINSGDNVTVRLTSSSSYSTLVSATLNAGGVSANFNVTTKANSGGGGGGGGGGGSYYSYANTNSGTSSATSSGVQNINGSVINSNNKKNIKKIKVSFNDTNDSFAKDDINQLVNKGVIKGYSDGTFRPNNTATRAEFLAMTMKAFNVDLSSQKTNEFSDLQDDISWIIPYTTKAKELGIISGQIIDGKLLFRPNDPITRAEALVILFKTAKIDTRSNKKLDFQDKFSTWMTSYVIKAKELGIISGQIIDGKLLFRPNDPITRAETARIITKTLFLTTK